MRNSVNEATFEFTIEKMAQQSKRWFYTILVLLILFVGTNILWIIHHEQHMNCGTEVCTNEVIEEPIASP